METRDADLRRWREFWEDEIAGAALYRALAEASQGERREIFEQLAAAEERHAGHWAALLERAGVTGLRPGRLPFRVRILSAFARRFGTKAVLPLVMRFEAADAAKYRTVAEAPEAMSREEDAHGQVVAALGGEPIGGQIAQSEGRHRSAATGGALRAAVFGINDGLVSNLALVMGVAGGTGDPDIILLAGVAGLLAGSFSMAAGEWVSVRSMRELYEREIAVEREELIRFPEEEREELVLIFRAKGLKQPEAESLAERIMSQPDAALDTLAREELGLDPGELASPWIAAGASFSAFAVGASIPVLPFVVAGGTGALPWAAGLSIGVLFAVGAFISVFTGRSSLWSGLRMALIGSTAAAVTYGVGTLLGVVVD